MESKEVYLFHAGRVLDLIYRQDFDRYPLHFVYDEKDKVPEEVLTAKISHMRNFWRYFTPLKV